MREQSDFQYLLPAAMQAKWAVVPRFFLYQLCFVGTLLGAGAALAVVGFTTGDGRLRLAFPVAIGLAWLQNQLLSRYERRLVRAATQHLSPGDVRPG